MVALYMGHNRWGNCLLKYFKFEGKNVEVGVLNQTVPFGYSEQQTPEAEDKQ